MGRTTTGPGPGKYILPSLVGYANHDPSRYRNPQYSIGLKVQKTKKDLGPGPKYNTEHMTSHGKANPPAYSIASRHGISKTFQSPSPANYDLQNAPRIKEPRPPAYSMTSRHYTGTTFQTPGPNNYEIPTTLGPKVPDKPANGAFSMSNRYPVLSKEQSPGPAKYDPTEPNRYKLQPPKYSISIKYPDLKSRSQVPGPSNYYPKLSQKNGYSFGLKHENPPYITAEDDLPCINK